MTPTSPEDRLAALASYVGQMLGNLPYHDAALTEASVVGNLIRQLEISLKSIQQQVDGNEALLNQTRSTLDQETGVMKSSISSEIEQVKVNGNVVIQELKKELHQSSQQQEHTEEAWTGITKCIQNKMMELDALQQVITDMKTVLDKELSNLQGEATTAKGAPCRSS